MDWDISHTYLQLVTLLTVGNVVCFAPGKDKSLSFCPVTSIGLVESDLTFVCSTF